MRYTITDAGDFVWLPDTEPIEPIDGAALLHLLAEATTVSAGEPDQTGARLWTFTPQLGGGGFGG